MTPNPYYAPFNHDLAAAYGLPLETVDNAIDSALEHVAKVEGWARVPTDLTLIIRLYISSDVTNTLDSHVQMGEAA
ncbi:hypothetical protein [Streptomyces sp. AC495_CC817]|uniref:hypothetical protein n=1 Tax=Streptomyces sp. AC495_CC817 TaxID=2823900 RepID=UPI001C26CE2C|nr:hypothetical protein [Streptomyces sp. AC495_CC817]